VVNLKDHWHRLNSRVSAFIDPPAEGAGRHRRTAGHLARFALLVWRQIVADRLIVVAGHLTFKTLLGLIPVLVLFLLVINFFWHGVDTSNQVRDAMMKALNISEIQIQVDGEDVDLAKKLDSIVEAARANINAAAAVGILILFYLAMSVLATIEGAMNRIWGVRHHRPLWKRGILFWLFLTLGPPAVAALYYASIYINLYVTGLPPWLQALWSGLLALLANVFVLFVMYKLLPSVPVRAWSALVGALVAGTLWHFLAKNAFETYVRHSTGYGQMYGNLAVVPLFFLWLYVTWLFVLFGFEVAYIVQNYRDLVRALAHERAREPFPPVEFVALVAMTTLARRFREGRGSTPLAQLVEATGLAQVQLTELLDRLESAHLLARTANGGLGDAVAFLPAREPGSITAADVLSAVRSRLPVPIDAAHLPLYREVRAAWDRLEADRGTSAGRMTLADLAAQDSAAG
jgi:membrane protein